MAGADPRLTGLAVTGAAAAGALLALAWLWPDADSPLEQGCALLAPGDSLGDAFALLGVEDFLPGCGRVAPCGTTVQTARGPVALSCTAADCSQQWRRDGVICFVEADADGTITQVELRVLPL